MFGFLAFCSLHRRRIAFNQILNDRDLLGAKRFFFLRLLRIRVVSDRLNGFCQFEARFLHFEALVVLTDALNVIVRRFQAGIRHQHDGHTVPCFEFGDVVAFFIQKECRNVNRHLSTDRTRAFLHRFFLQNAEHLNGAGFRISNDAYAVAARAGDVAAFREGRTQTLTRKLHQAETADFGRLYASAVIADGIFETLLHGTLVLRFSHVDEVDHDQTAQVAQTHLAGHFVGSFTIGLEGRFFNIRAAGCTGRVHVNGDERFSVVNHNSAAGRQRHRAGIGCFDLLLNLKAREERDVVAVALDAVNHIGHDVRHELTSLFVDIVCIDQNFADLRLEVITNGTNNKVRFFNNQERCGVGALAFLAVDLSFRQQLGMAVFSRIFVDRTSCVSNGFPEFEQIVEIPLKLFGRAADAGSTGNGRHAVRKLEAIHRFPKFLTFFALNAAGDTAGTRVVRHQNKISAGETDEGRKRSAFIAALFLFDLNDQLLAFMNRFLNGCKANIHTFSKVAPGDLLERKEAVAFFAVIDETRFKRGLDTGYNAHVNVGLAGFSAGSFNIDVDELLAIDDANAGFFRMRGVKKHALHEVQTPCGELEPWSSKSSLRPEPQRRFSLLVQGPNEGVPAGGACSRSASSSGEFNGAGMRR